MNGHEKDFEKVRTTMGIKLATKYLILDHSLPGESMEDTVVRLIKNGDRLEKEMDEMKELVQRNDLKLPNSISSEKERRGLGLVGSDEDLMIRFTYNLPDMDTIDDEYIMDITIEEALLNGKKIDAGDLGKRIVDLKVLHLKMVEYVINRHFDRAFSMPKKMNLIDPRYWKRISLRVGLPERSYLNDILSIIEKE